MTRLDLDSLRATRDRLNANRDPKEKRIIIGAGTACQASGANAIQRLMKRYTLERDLVERVKLRITGDLGFCVMAPYLVIEPAGLFYVKVKPEDVPRIIDSVVSDEILEDLVYQDPSSGLRLAHQNEIPFFHRQRRTILGKNQQLDPIRLHGYIRQDGYRAVEKALGELQPEDIIDEMKRSGLRGRGGAGFPSWRKWHLAAQQDGSRGKYLVCNADEGDPGAYMDRGILEGNPHSIIEGMIIGGRAMGATEGFIYVRHEYPLAIKNTIIALRLAHDHGLLGKDILGTGFDFDIHIVRGAGAFVCGEETALIRSIEGHIGEPRQRPPYPIERGIDGRPTCINNVETWANVPGIILGGGDEFSQVGTEASKGTKVFSLVGKIRNTGLVEVPMGTSIRELVYDIGGGAMHGGKIKAVQIGGPSGGCIPSGRFDLPIDYDSLTEAGAIMGSGGMIVMDDNTCMVDVAKYFMNFLRDESCGKCFTCRKGTQRLYELLDDITSGRGTLGHLDLLEELAQAVKDTTQCGLGQSAPNPVLSTLRYFRDEYVRHVVDKRCDAFVCKELVGAPCQSACPVGTEAWKYIAHIAAGDYEKAYVAIREHNPFPSVCARVCDHKCEQRCRLGATGESPVAIRSLKRFVTDRIDPSVFQAQRSKGNGASGKRVAVVGAGPGGLAAAHYLSLMGYKVTVLEESKEPGGMLRSGVPAYRLPRDVLRKEIDALIDDNIELKCNTALGRDVTLDGLFEQGHQAVFLALGAHRSKPLGIEGEAAEGVVPSISFLKAWNHDEKSLARGRVGIIGGGNSAIDAARVAVRQPGIESVSVFYRRTRHEMPAYDEEIEAALEEGVQLETLVTPTSVSAKGGRLEAIEFLRNTLGEVDTSGRRRPVPEEGSEFKVPLDTLVVAIGEQPEAVDCEGTKALEFWKNGAIKIDGATMQTARPGVFAGGDFVTGPNTVIDAIAAGKRAAMAIDRHLRGEPLHRPGALRLPEVQVPAVSSPDGLAAPERAHQSSVAVGERVKSFGECELSLDEKQACGEATRCLRCDLEFTERQAEPVAEQAQQAVAGGEAS